MPSHDITLHQHSSTTSVHHVVITQGDPQGNLADVASQNCSLIPAMETKLSGHHFDNDDEVIGAVDLHLQDLHEVDIQMHGFSV